jgi:hypothetical protein
LTDQERKALDAFDAASKKLAGKGGQGVENKYAAAYKLLVSLGLRPQIRRKYR